MTPSKEEDKVEFWWTLIKEKQLKLFEILIRFQDNSQKIDNFTRWQMTKLYQKCRFRNKIIKCSEIENF